MGNGRIGQFKRLTLSLVACTSLAACQRDVEPRTSHSMTGAAAQRTAYDVPRPISPRRTAAVARPITSRAPPSAAINLDAAVERLGRDFPGDVGLAIRDVQTGWTSHHRGFDFFPQQSVSKLWVSLTALDQVDAHRFDLSRPLLLTASDLTLFHQPIRTLAARPGGYRTDAEDLMTRALTQSDNTANDRLLREVGGPDAVRETLRRKAIGGIRFGPGEERLQASIAGLAWPSDWAGGDGFYTAREALPSATRRAAFDAYVRDPMDGATPLGMVDALARLTDGQLLSPGSTARMTGIMAQTRTGALRLKAGLKPGWTLSHKTGTGQVLEGEQAGYNDVGLLTSPEGNTYAVAVLIGRTARPLAERMTLMRKVVDATVDYDAALGRQRAAAG